MYKYNSLCWLTDVKTQDSPPGPVLASIYIWRRSQACRDLLQVNVPQSDRELRAGELQIWRETETDENSKLPGWNTGPHHFNISNAISTPTFCQAKIWLKPTEKDPSKIIWLASLPTYYTSCVWLNCVLWFIPLISGWSELIIEWLIWSLSSICFTDRCLWLKDWVESQVDYSNLIQF